MIDFDGLSYDICIITKWDDDGVQIINYYFGDYDQETTDYYIDNAPGRGLKSDAEVE